MKPCDVRAFDVNEKILSKLRKESKGFYDDALTFQYELVSDKLQAQYFLTKFHANKKWDMSLFCILDYRLSSFILPGCIPEEKAADLPEDKIVLAPG